VNIDFEAMNSADRGNLLNNFMHDLTTFIHTELPGKEVSFDGPAVNWSGWNLDGLAQSVDYIFIMAYDYYGSWSDNTGPVAPLTDPNGGHCVQRSLNSTYNGPLVKYPQKLILGVPYYGKHWKTATGNAGSAVTSYVGSTFYRKAVIEAETYGGFIWDNASQTPWYKWQSGGWHQVWNDNEKSLGKKYDYALTENIGGVGIWALNYDGTRTELWNLINTKFAGAVTPIPGRPKSPVALSKDTSTITLKFKPGNYADGYRVYQSSDNNQYTMVIETADTVTDIA
jgi:spore germination protein YaaH